MAEQRPRRRPAGDRPASARPLAARLVAAWLLLGPAISLATAAAPGDGGTTLADLLQSISRDGVQLIYSSDSVPRNLRATMPPPGLPIEQRLRMLLSPAGLTAHRVANGAYVIVRVPADGVLQVSVILERAGQLEPLAGASVEIVNGHRSASSDAAGQVEFDHLPPGRYDVEARYPGLRPVTRSIQLGPDAASPRAELHLAWIPAMLEEIRVEGQREETGAAGSRTVPRETLQDIPDTSSDAARVLQLLPGAAVAGYTAKTHVRGSRDDENLFRFDGLTLTDPYHFEALQSLNSAIDPTVIDSATSWTGVAPVNYDGASGAVVDLRPRTVRATLADVRLSNRDFNAVAGLPFGDDRGTLLGEVRLTNEQSPVLWLENPSFGPSLYDYLLRSTWTFSPDSRVAAGLLAVDDQRSTLSTEQAPEDQRARFESSERYFWLHSWQNLTPQLASETFASAERSVDSAVGRVDLPAVESGFSSQHNLHKALTLREELSYGPEGAWSLLGGAQAIRAGANDSLDSSAQFLAPFAPGVQPVAQTAIDAAASTWGTALSAYMDLKWRRNEDSQLDLGLRHDSRRFSSSFAGDAHWSGSASYRERILPSTTVRAGWGRTAQLSVTDLDEYPDGTLRPAAPRIQNQLDAGIDQAVGPLWTLHADVYDKREVTPYGTTVDAFTPFSLLPEIALGSRDLTSSGSRMRGLELQLASDPRRPWNGWISYTWSGAQDRIDDQWIDRSWNQPHAAQGGLRWSQGAWHVAAIYSWHSGWPTTPLLASATTWQDPRSVALGLGPFNGARLPDPASMDLRIGWAHPWGAGLFEIALEINDVTDARAICCRNYSVMHTTTAYQLVETTGYWLGFSPQLTFRWHL